PVDDATAGSPLGTGAPLALLWSIEPVRGLNSIDYLRYRQYLQFLAGTDQQPHALEGYFMMPLINNFPIRHKSLLDLLGVRYLLQPSEMPLDTPGWRCILVDPRPVNFDYLVGGMQPLPTYSLYENSTVLPRVFVVAQAHYLAESDQILPTLAETD